MAPLDQILRELGYTRQWIEAGVVDEEFLQRQYDEFLGLNGDRNRGWLDPAHKRIPGDLVDAGLTQPEEVLSEVQTCSDQSARLQGYARWFGLGNPALGLQFLFTLPFHDA